MNRRTLFKLLASLPFMPKALASGGAVGPLDPPAKVGEPFDAFANYIDPLKHGIYYDGREFMASADSWQVIAGRIGQSATFTWSAIDGRWVRVEPAEATEAWPIEAYHNHVAPIRLGPCSSPPQTYPDTNPAP